MTDTNTPQHSGDELPSALVDAIRQRHGPDEIAVPGHIDEAVLADASAYLKTISKPRRASRSASRWAVGTLAATSLAAAVMLVLLPKSADPLMPASPVVADAEFSEAGRAEAQTAAVILRDDIDRNGQVDILDAFALARNIRRGDLQPAWDQNGDGQLDQEDVDQIARNAVML
ncbi:MAG: hypothetical protein R3C19_09260 [Planctomycetaceae bacterium]